MANHFASSYHRPSPPAARAPLTRSKAVQGVPTGPTALVDTQCRTRNRLQLF